MALHNRNLSVQLCTKFTGPLSEKPDGILMIDARVLPVLAAAAAGHMISLAM